MQSNVTRKTVWLVLLFSILLMGADNSAQDAEERGKLLKQQKQLNSRIRKLTREQDFLVFQRAMYASDSKYLIIDISKKTGQLKYKNRVLKDFQFKRVSGRVSRLTRGTLTLTQKIEGIRERNLLVFERSMVLQGARVTAVELEKGIPRFSLSRKDFLSIYYAIEAGAKAYILL